VKTTVDIPDKVLEDAMRFTKASTKRECIVRALEELNRRERVGRLIEMLGKSDTFMTLDELIKVREADKNRTYL
jgi:Arc/MetJ family transcription regulator